MTDAEESRLSLASCHSAATSIPVRHFSPDPSPPPRHSSLPTSGEAEAGLLPRVPPPPKKHSQRSAAPLSPADSSGSYPSSTLLLRDDLKEARRDLLLKTSQRTTHCLQTLYSRKLYSKNLYSSKLNSSTLYSTHFQAPGSCPLPRLLLVFRVTKTVSPHSPVNAFGFSSRLRQNKTIINLHSSPLLGTVTFTSKVVVVVTIKADVTQVGISASWFLL